MNKVMLTSLKSNQFMFTAYSGRSYLVSIAFAGAVGECHDFQFTLQQVDGTGVAITGTQPRVITKSMNKGCIAARSHGYTDFWRAMTNTPAPESGWPTLPVPPGLTAPGPTSVSGANWYAGNFDITKNTNDPNILCPTLGNRGDFYVDLGTGLTWKKRGGDLEWLAMKEAEFMENLALADDALTSLNLPALPATTAQ